MEKAIEGFEIGCAVMGNETVFAAVSMRYRLPEASLILKVSTKIKALISSVRQGSMKSSLKKPRRLRIVPIVR